MKVIFLDIDGVLNTTETFIKRIENYERTGSLNLEIDEFRLEYLKSIIDSTGAKIVLSSTWRRYFTKNNELVMPITEKGKALYNLFSKYGIDIYDITVINVQSRENQVKEWLSNRDNVESFIIIDDEPNRFKDLLDKLIKTSRVKDNQILTNMDDCVGLCEHHIELSKNMLNSKVKVKK